MSHIVKVEISVQGGGVKKSLNFADILYGCPLVPLLLLLSGDAAAANAPYIKAAGGPARPYSALQYSNR